jgi:CRISPR/Cas system-associated endonuclease Cas1
MEKQINRVLDGQTGIRHEEVSMNMEHFSLAADLMEVSRKIIMRLREKGFSDAEVEEMLGRVREYGKLRERILSELVIQAMEKQINYVGE